MFKHDSWAATALYEDPEGVLRVVKLHRQAPLLVYRIGWLGRRTASQRAKAAGATGRPARDSGSGGPGRAALDRSSAMPSPGTTSPAIPWATARPVSDTFFPDLNRLLKEMHERRTVYVDLHKRENIIVNERGEPCLIDFQISLTWPRWLPSGPLFRIFRGATSTI